MSGPIRVLEFESVEAMRAHYKALRVKTLQVRRNRALALTAREAAPPPPAAPSAAAAPERRPTPFWVDPWAELRTQADALVRAGAQRARALALEEREAEASGYEPIRDVIARHAAANRVSVSAVLSPVRTADVVRARHAAMFEVWDEGRRMSLSQVGRIFGRDHTTVLSAIRQVRKRHAAALTCDPAEGGPIP